MKEYRARVLQLANYFLENKSTIRETAKHFNMAKSTVHYDLSYRLKYEDLNLFLKVKQILNYNFSDKHNRGGRATKLLYEHLNKKKKTR